MKSISLLKLFLIFVKVGAILLGGGYVILPILTSELIDKRSLIEYDELVDYFALSQSLPGLIAANISIFIGYKLRGKSGALVAMLGVIFVPILTIIFLASILGSISTNHMVQSALWGVGVAVIALILLTVREMWVNSTKNLFFYIIFLAALIALLVFKLSPIKTILIFSTIGVIYKALTTPKEAR